MIVLIIIAAIILLLFLLLLPRLSVDIAFRDGEFFIYLRYLFLKIDFSGDRMDKILSKVGDKPEKKPETKKEKQIQEAEEVEEATEKGLEKILPLIKSSKKGLLIFCRHLVFSKVKIYICVGGGDAHKAAMTYSYTGMIVAAVLDILGLVFVLRKPQVGIAPDFTAEKTRYDISFRVGMRPIFLIGAAMSMLMGYIRTPKKKKHRKKKAN